MESINLEMDDLFDQEADDDDDIGGHHAVLPELDEGADGPMRQDENGEAQDDEEGVVANLQKLSKGAAKKKVMRPQPKLDAERLKSERGLASLPHIFENVKFKGKGYEADDLKMMMGKLEHWAHRLYPPSTFDQFIERMEKLGAKKPVQTCVKRIRLGMAVLDNDFVTQYDQAIPENDEPVVNGDNDTGRMDIDAEEAFEEMIRQERATQQTKSQTIIEDDLDSSQNITETPTKPTPMNDHTSSINTPLVNSSPVSTADPATGLTPDAKARIEANKRKALEKRAARLGVTVESLLPPKSDEKKPAEENPAETEETSGNQRKPVVTEENPVVTEEKYDKKAANSLASDAVDTNFTENSEESRHMENDMQTEDQLLDALSDDLDESTKVRQTSNNQNNSNSMLLKEGLNKDNQTSSESGNENLETMDLGESEWRDLLPDASVSENIDNTECDTLNLQLDLSVNESDDPGLRSPPPES